ALGEHIAAGVEELATNRNGAADDGSGRRIATESSRLTIVGAEDGIVQHDAIRGGGGTSKNDVSWTIEPGDTIGRPAATNHDVEAAAFSQDRAGGGITIGDAGRHRGLAVGEETPGNRGDVGPNDEVAGIGDLWGGEESNASIGSLALDFDHAGAGNLRL